MDGPGGESLEARTFSTHYEPPLLTNGYLARMI